MSRQLLTPQNLAERWGVATGHVYHLARSGALPAVRLGRYVRFRLDAIEEFELAGGVAQDELMDRPQTARRGAIHGRGDRGVRRTGPGR